MFDPRRLIREVELRPCLWDLKNKNYTNRSMRRIAWDQIAKELNFNWHTYNVTNKKEIVNDIQSKWKHIREFYLREKKKNNIGDGNSAFKTRVPQYFDMLSFLEGAVDNRSRDSKVDFDKTNDVVNPNDMPILDIDSFFLPQSQEQASSESCDDIMAALQSSLLNNIGTKETAEEDPDKGFLLSLLPEIKTMTPKQKFDFKFEILSAIKRIKYDPPPPPHVDGNHFCPEPISSTEFGLVDGSMGFTLP